MDDTTDQNNMNVGNTTPSPEPTPPVVSTVPVEPTSVTPPATSPSDSFVAAASPPVSPKSNKSLLMIVLIAFLTLSIPAAVFLSQQTQDIRQRAAGGGSWGECSGNGCNSPTSFCFVNHYTCDNTGAQNCTSNDAGINPNTGLSGASFSQDCGSEQIDMGCSAGNAGANGIYHCNDGSRGYLSLAECQGSPLCTGETCVLLTSGSKTIGYVWNSYDQNCSEPPPSNEPNPSPTPSPRPDFCVDASVDKPNLTPGQSVVMTSVSNTAVNDFYYVLYNRDNENSPGNPKAICVTTGGDVTNIQGDCPTGTYTLIFKDSSTTLRTNGTRTVPYAQLFVADQNWAGQTVERIQINAYFSTTGGQWSLPQAACVAYVTSQTNPVAQCNGVNAYQVNGAVGTAANWQTLSATDLAGKDVGDVVYFTCHGTELNGANIDKARIRVNSTTWTAANETSILKPKTTPTAPDEYYILYTIPASTIDFVVQGEVHDQVSNAWY